MDEYIKREDALDAVLFALVGTGYQSKAIYAIRELPTADVVPKSEVIAIFDELESIIDLVGAMVGLDIRLYGSYAELKKKYTEEKK